MTAVEAALDEFTEHGLANLASVAIEKARLHEAVLKREKEQKEIELARKVQLGFLPQTFPDVPGYEFYAHYSPAQTVGGDYSDFVMFPDRRIACMAASVMALGSPPWTCRLTNCATGLAGVFLFIGERTGADSALSPVWSCELRCPIKSASRSRESASLMATPPSVREVGLTLPCIC